MTRTARNSAIVAIVLTALLIGGSIFWMQTSPSTWPFNEVVPIGDVEYVGTSIPSPS